MSGWGCLRKVVFEHQYHICGYCGEFADLDDFVLHHIRNRSMGGRDIFENAEGRHKWCEVEAHELYPYGNPRGGGGNVRRRIRKHLHLRKHR